MTGFNFRLDLELYDADIADLKRYEERTGQSVDAILTQMTTDFVKRTIFEERFRGCASQNSGVKARVGL